MVSTIRHKTHELSIDLASTEIILMGHAAESAGKLLRGSVTLHLTEPMKVRSVNLQFNGKMKVSWSEGIGHHQHYHKQEKEIIDHKWQFVPIIPPISSATDEHNHHHSKKAFTLGAGDYKWDFEFLLPGDLPQSLEAEGGQVVYRLKAIVERTAFSQNIVKKQVLQVVRCMLPSEFDLIQSLEIHNTWAEKMMYDIVLPSKVYARGSLIPITFHITPIASGLRVRSLIGTLKEYCTYTANDCSKTDTRIVKLHKEEDPFNSNTTTALNQPINWTKDIRLDIPPMSSQMAFCDADNEMIRIRHKLKFVICLVNADGHLSELRCSVPVIIISSISEQTELNTLPAYEQAWRSVLCLESGPSTPGSAVSAEDPVETMHYHVTHSSPMPMAAASNTHNNDTQEDDGLPTQSPSAESIWWNGENLSRVPSYNTAAQQAPVTLSTSLPSYDQLAGSPRHAAMFGQLSMSYFGQSPSS